MSEKKNGLSKSLINLALTALTLFKFIPQLFYLIEEEACIAGKSLTALLILYLIAGSLFTSTWMCVLIIAYIYLTSLKFSALSALFLLVFVNLLLIFIIGLIIINKKRGLTFSQTRRLFQK